MKKLIFILASVLFMSSCTVFPGQTNYQTNNLRKFDRKKHTGSFVAKHKPKKQGSFNHPAVRKEDRKWQIRRMRHGD